MMAPQPHPDFDLDEEPPSLRPYNESQLISVSRWQPTDLGPILRGEHVTPPPSVFARNDGVKLLYPSRINAFFGETESCKTLIAQMVVAQELGLGHHVVYGDFEDGPESMVERLRALGVDEEHIASRLTYLNPSGTFDELAQAVLQEAIEERGNPTLAVLDGVTEAMADIGLDPMSGTDVAAYYAGSPRWLARTGAAVALIDHVTKSQEGRGRWAIGSERKVSGLTGAGYSFEPVQPFGRGRTGLVKVTVAKDRLGYVRRHQDARGVVVMAELKSRPDDGIAVTFSAPESSDGLFRPTCLMAKLSDVIAANPGWNIRALRAAVTGKNDAKDLALQLLVSEDFVKVEPGDRGARLHYSVRPFVDEKDGELDEAF